MVTYTRLEPILNYVMGHRKRLRREVPVSGTKYLTAQKMTWGILRLGNLIVNI